MLILALVLTVATVLKLNVKTNTSISIDTEYGRIIIEDTIQDGEPVRLYKQSGAYFSASFLNDNKKNDLVFDYLKKYDEMFNYLDVKNVAMIGGAAYQYPKYFISHFLDKKMDVIEIDPASTEIAKKYFFLDDLIHDYGAERLGLYNEDGRAFLDKTNKKYDAILNDVFAGDVLVKTLATKEAAEIVKARLDQGGVYMSNILTSLTGDKAKFLRSEIKTLKEIFKYVYVVPFFENVEDDAFTNWMLIATDNDSYRPNGIKPVEITDEDVVLMDD